MSLFYSMKFSPNLHFTGLLIALFACITGYLVFWGEGQVFWAGYASMLAFYVVTFYMGAQSRLETDDQSVEEVMLAGRNMPLVLAIFTMAATWIDGGYINGSAEYAANKAYGLIWVQAPWGYAFSLVIGGLFFAKRMRSREYKTMLDPLDERFGKRITAVLFVPALLGEIFWTATILTALGMTFGVVTGMGATASIVICSITCIGYAALGGIRAIAVTDVLLITSIVVGLLVVLFFALPQVGGLSLAWADYQSKMGAAASFLPDKAYLGTSWWSWWDSALLLIFGGIPWQVYFQRVLSAKSPQVAQNLSILGGVVCILVAIPAVLIGVVGFELTELNKWAELGATQTPLPAEIAPYVMRYAVPTLAAILGLGAIASAVMSSVAASVLSAASMGVWNVVVPFRSKETSPEQLSNYLKSSTILIGLLATFLSLKVQSVYALWVLCSDFVYCFLFPALVCALFIERVKGSHVILGLIVAFVLRFGGGDASLGLPQILPYPTDANGLILVPYKSIAMVSSLLIMVLSSYWPSNKNTKTEPFKP